MTKQPYEISKPNLVWPVLDAVYNNLSELQAVTNDSILIGRFVLVKYSDEIIPLDRCIEMEQALRDAGGTENDIGKVAQNDNETQYLENFVKDGCISKDRIVYQKQAVKLSDTSYGPMYVEICCLREPNADFYEKIKNELMYQWFWNDTYLFEEA